MQGAIQQARRSKSGQTLSVQVDGKWYTTKNWDFEQMIGQVITFEPSRQNFSDGGGIDWINDYGVSGGAPTTADQAFNQAHTEANPPPMGMPPAMTAASNAQPAPQGVPPSVDRDASIVAQALTKASCTPGEPMQQVWERYMGFYHKYITSGWNDPF